MAGNRTLLIYNMISQLIFGNIWKGGIRHAFTFQLFRHSQHSWFPKNQNITSSWRELSLRLTSERHCDVLTERCCYSFFKDNNIEIFVARTSWCRKESIYVDKALRRKISSYSFFCHSQPRPTSHCQYCCLIIISVHKTKPPQCLLSLCRLWFWLIVSSPTFNDVQIYW